MERTLFSKGFVLGVSIAAPVGPVGLLCLRRSLERGILAGFTSGLGAAAADLLYGIAAAAGLGAALSKLTTVTHSLEFAGGIFLVWLGCRTARRPAARMDDSKIQTRGLLRGFVSTFLLCATNPLTILSFAAMFAGIGVEGGTTASGAMMLAAGVFAGSASWWLFLSGIAACLGPRLSDAGLRWTNRASGAALIAFGMRTLFR